MCDRATYNTSLLCMKYLVNIFFALIMQLKFDVASEGQGQMVAKSKVTKKAVWMFNSHGRNNGKKLLGCQNARWSNN